MTQWASFIGLLLTAIGILLGFSLPTVAARWGGPETSAQEVRLRTRFVLGVGCILIGTALQMYAAWPRN